MLAEAVVKFQELKTELDKTESLVTQLNSDVGNLSADQLFADLDDVTQLLMQVNSKWENLRSRVTTTECKSQMLAESYPSFTGELWLSQMLFSRTVFHSFLSVIL